MKTILSLLFAAALSAVLPACSPYTDLSAGTVLEITSQDAVVETETVEIPRMPQEPPPAVDYLLGAGDVLFVNVQGNPELGSPSSVAGGKNGVSGSRIDGNGNIHLPLIGTVQVAGRTVVEVRDLLTRKFSAFLARPWVVVEIVDYRSQPVYLLGQFKTAGVYYLDHPYTIVQGISLAGGLTDSANLRRARLMRDQKALPIDLHAVLQEGDIAQNIWLKAGDTLYVPDDKNLNVFVFGAVEKAGPIPMPNGQLNLSQALASAQMNDIRGEERLVRIIRSLSATRGQLIVVDLGKVLRGESLPFPLYEGDIVYVPRSGVGSWNGALAELLPSLQTVSAILTPFVQIRYLSEND